MKKNVLMIEKIFCRFEVEGQEFSKFLRFLYQSYSNNEMSEQFLKQNTYPVLFIGGYNQIFYIGTIKIPIGTKNWDV